MGVRRASKTGSSSIKYKVARSGHTAIPALPEAPTIGTATAAPVSAIVAFTPNPKGGLASSYTVTSSPGGITATGSSSPITVAGLTFGTPYTFTVTATNSSGTSGASASSNSVTPTEAVLFQITSSGTWTAPSSGTYEIHCVGGGGGGGGYYGSGGAGGFYSTTTASLTGGTAYSVTVGGFGARADSGTAGSGGTTRFTISPVAEVVANGGGGGSARNFGTSGVGGNGGSGGAPAADASTGFGGGGGGYDGSHSSKSTSASYGGQNVGTGQLGVAIGLGTNTFIPAGGASSFKNGTHAGTRSGLGGIYQGIYGFGVGHGGNYPGVNEEGQNGVMATGNGCGGGGANWFANGSGNGSPGMIVLKKLS